ncbi:hypothetical protein [Leptolyngbya sp. FACHB-261]|uniref:hypothetical protein n=1 Tax=Leptolyngbya sp. FACHB-261 TaxID=2692806 RepID=UPI001688D229|nr:hypothetical protein [Leptolyngbya sp. FACHB-261]MBD2099759.1 hypothetical protein [Leptolyngbya sp. FACHB-261]
MSSTGPAPQPAPQIVRQHLQNVRLAFLRLHKALLDSERVQYERVHGRIATSGDFFRLVIGHEWFNWLRPMSQFVAQVDETLAAKQPMTLEQVNGFLATARQLIRSSAEGTPQEQRYYQAIERDPEVARLHVVAADLLADPAQ